MFIDELERTGHKLFRYRSYVFLIIAPVAAYELLDGFNYLLGSRLAESVYGLVCFAISLSGLVVRAISIGSAAPGTSGKNTKEQVADNLNTSGMYSICRHPLYLGNGLMAAGVLLFLRLELTFVLGMMLYYLVYERIIATEEGYLNRKFGEPFREWAARTPAILPKFSAWQPPIYPFSFKPVLRGEIYSFTSLVTVIYLMNAAKDSMVAGKPEFQPAWTISYLIIIVAFFTLRHLRKHTTLLDRK